MSWTPANHPLYVSPRRYTWITCSCGHVTYEGWGPESEVSGVRTTLCRACGRAWRFRADPERGFPLKVVFNPVSGSEDGIAWWDD